MTTTSPATPGFPCAAAAIVTSDVTVFDQPSGVYVGTGGTVVVMPWDGTTAVSFLNAQSGSTIPIMVRQVRAATTATDLVRLF